MKLVEFVGTKHIHGYPKTGAKFVTLDMSFHTLTNCQWRKQDNNRLGEIGSFIWNNNAILLTL